MSITPAMRQALIELKNHTGEGVITKLGSLLAGGVRLKAAAETWLRLVSTGHIESRGPMRLGLTDLGCQEAEPVPFKFNRGGGYSDGRVPPYSGAE